MSNTLFEQTNVSAGEAFVALRAGKSVSREGWNGKGLYACKIPAGNAMYKGKAMKDCYGLVTPDGYIQAGWVMSTGDMNANDWCIHSNP